MAEIYTRRILEVVHRRMGAAPVVVLEGPRTVGKSTLLREIASAAAAAIVDLDDSVVKRDVEQDPHRYAAARRPVLVDEYLRFPPFPELIKAELNKDGSPGQFVLTGSAHREPQGSGSGLRPLVGRMTTLPVLPLSQLEIDRRPGNFVEEAFEDAAGALPSDSSSATRDSYMERVLTGGFPNSLSSSSQEDRDQRFEDYITQSIQYGVADLSGIHDQEALRLLLYRYASQTGQLLNMTKAAGDVGIQARTAANYTRFLEAIFLIHLLPAWKRTDRGPASRPKVHVVDSGVGGRLLRLGPEKIRSNDPLFQSQYGNLVETFVVGEVRKMASWMSGPSRIGYWRNQKGDEVDLVVERPDEDKVIGIEVKSSSRVTSGDWRGLRLLRDKLGPRFRAGLVMNMGGTPREVEERIYALPIDALWGGGLPVAETPPVNRDRARVGMKAGKGRSTAPGDPLPTAVRTAAQEMINRLKIDQAAYWELAAIPSESIHIDDFYTPAGAAGALAGIKWAQGLTIEPIEQCVSVVNTGVCGVLIHPLGSMVAVLAGAEGALAVSRDRLRITSQPRSSLPVDEDAVTGWALGFTRFVHRHLLPYGRPVSWVYWTAGRRLASGCPSTSDEITSLPGVGPPRPAVVDNPLYTGIPLEGDPEVEAFHLKASFYGWFGRPAGELRESGQGRISATIPYW